MGADIQWAIGLFVALFSALITTLIASFRNLAGRIMAVDREGAKRSLDMGKDLNEKIDAVKEKYVRRDDMDAHLRRIDQALSEVKTELDKNHQQLIKILTKS